MASKKIMGILLSLALVFSMTACSKSEETTKKAKKEKEQEEETEDEDEDEDEDESEEDVTEDTDDTEDTEDTEEGEDPSQNGGSGIVDPDANIDSSDYVTGVLSVLGESYDYLFDGVYLSSPATGTYSMNAGAYRTAFIRALFETNDHIEIYLSGVSSNGDLAAYLVPHHNIDDIYTEDYVKALPDEVVRTELADPNDPNWYWGSLDLNSDNYEPGYYDILFTEGGTPVATITVVITADGSLSDINDAEYYAMLKEEMDAHGMSALYETNFERFSGCLEQGIWPDEYTWSGSGLPTLPCENPEAEITIDPQQTTVQIVADLINEDEETACVAIDDVFTLNGYGIAYPGGDSDANYRYVFVVIDNVPCEISYWGYNGQLHLTINNLIANA